MTLFHSPARHYTITSGQQLPLSADPITHRTLPDGPGAGLYGSGQFSVVSFCV
jgi:hypothetical protein